ncbi:hypothetical protein [Streptomyces sp. NBC_01334]|uniref:hypothetical protein n=1 Tax=Streptomyces sp. NBC_01334 TaxID=2903827 RepID=UPI002E161C5D|nr:hypothetical protein OG736_43775 [Streptomyces sp. NBC_01334]
MCSAARPRAAEMAGVLVYDPYAHHPDEVSEDLAAARSLVGQGGRVDRGGALRRSVHDRGCSMR